MNTINVPFRTLKKMAKEMMKGKYWACVFVLLLANVISAAPSMLVSALTTSRIINDIATIAGELISIYFDVALASFFLAIFRGKPGKLDDLTDISSSWPTAVYMTIIAELKIMIGIILFIVPGIIVAINHSQMYYILVEHPDYNARQCIEESKKMMVGNRWKYVGYTFSFVGWMILAKIPESIYAGNVAMNSGITFAIPQGLSVQEYVAILDDYSLAITSNMNSLVVFLLGLIPVFVMAYVTMGMTAFYDVVSGGLIVEDIS